MDTPKRYFNVTLSIEECSEDGVVPAVWPESHSPERLTVFLTKRLEARVIEPENLLTMRQHQKREAIGEERDNGQYLGIAFPAHHENGFQLLKAAIVDYIAARLGVGNVVKSQVR